MEYLIAFLFAIKLITVTVSLLIIYRSRRTKKKLFDYSHLKANEETPGTAKDARICNCNVHTVKYNLN